MKHSLRAPLRAFTLIEMMVALGVIAATGGILVSGIRGLALLGAKNSAINLTHQQQRAVLHNAVSELHQSVSIPSLVDASLGAVSGNGPSAGVTYQNLLGNPHKIWTGGNLGTSVLKINSIAGDPAPLVGQRLIVPAFRVEENITAVSSAGGTAPVYTVTLANPLPSTITCSSGSPSFVAYVTQRSALVMVNRDFRYYPSTATPATYYTLARNLSNATPFTVPGGDNRFIKGDFTAEDPRVSGLNLKSMFTQMDLTVPYRYRLTTKQ